MNLFMFMNNKAKNNYRINMIICKSLYKKLLTIKNKWKKTMKII